jgi:hypothetical protein
MRLLLLAPSYYWPSKYNQKLVRFLSRMWCQTIPETAGGQLETFSESVARAEDIACAYARHQVFSCSQIQPLTPIPIPPENATKHTALDICYCSADSPREAYPTIPTLFDPMHTRPIAPEYQPPSFVYPVSNTFFSTLCINPLHK